MRTRLQSSQFDFNFQNSALTTYTSVVQNEQRNAVSRLFPCPGIQQLQKFQNFFPSIRFISERWSANSRIENDSIIVPLVAFNYLLGPFDCFLLLNRVQEKIYRQGGKPRVSSLISQYCCLVSSVGRAPVCRAGVRWFNPNRTKTQGL